MGNINELEDGTPVYQHGEEDFKLLLMPTPAVLRGSFRSVDEAIEIIPESKWKVVDNRGKFDVTAFTLNQRSHGCHDDKTEVLTDRGWKLWTDYNWTDQLGTMNQTTGMMEFQSPIAKHVYDYDGPMHYSDNRSVNFSVTPNHRMYVRKWNEPSRKLESGYVFQEASNLGWYVGLPHAPAGFLGIELERVSVPGGREYLGDDFLALVALVISDGWAGSTDNTKNRVSFCCFREDRREMVAALAHRVGFTEQPGRKGVWLHSDPVLAEWLRQHVYTGDCYRSPFKRVPDLIKNVSQRQIGLFLKFIGDQDTDNRTGSRRFYSSSKRMIDDLQELLLRVGKRGSIASRPQRPATMKDGREVKAGNNPDITLNERFGDQLSLTKKQHIHTERYKGNVFCATVPNGTLITRRNGSVLISGNSCVGFSAAGALMKLRVMAGMTFKRLSGAYIYSYINGGRDQGANIGESLGILKIKGTCEESEVGWDQIYPNQIPAAAREHAKDYRVEEAFRVDTWEQAGSVLQCPDFALVYAVMVGSTFDRLDADGVVGFDRGAGNHAVHACGMGKFSQRWGWLLDGYNSWGAPWGDQGRFRSAKAHWEGVQQDAYALRVATYSEADLAKLPKAKE